MESAVPRGAASLISRQSSPAALEARSTFPLAPAAVLQHRISVSASSTGDLQQSRRRRKSANFAGSEVTQCSPISHGSRHQSTLNSRRSADLLSGQCLSSLSTSSPPPPFPSRPRSVAPRAGAPSECPVPSLDAGGADHVLAGAKQVPVGAGVTEGAVIVRDDLDQLLQCLPCHLREKLLTHPKRNDLLEVVMDLGRRPEARFLGSGAGEYLEEAEVTREDLQAAQECVGEFGGDNRAGVEGTLHRVSCMRNRRGAVVGLTCRVGRAVTGHVDMVRDLLHVGNSLLFLGRPGVGKTTVIREIARVLSDELHKRVVIVDTSNEIGGDGDVPHSAIGGARRMQVPDPVQQHHVMVEAVENHMPEVVIVDEIGTEAEALACRTIAERGVMLVGTAHGQLLENLIKNPTLCDLVGGVQTVTLGDEEARSRGTQKSVMERKAPPTFPLLIEMRERHFWVAHQVDKSVDALLHGKRPQVEVRTRDADFKVRTERRLYDRNGSSVSSGSGGFGRDSDLDPIPGFGLGSNDSIRPLVTVTAQRGMRENFLREINSLPEDVDATYMWAAKLGHVPDKDVMADYALPVSHRGGSWSDLDEEFHGTGGYISGSGKRGSKRGPRGVRPR